MELAQIGSIQGTLNNLNDRSQIFFFFNFVLYVAIKFRQNPWILVYVVGGITPGEMKALQVGSTLFASQSQSNYKVASPVRPC